MIRFRKIRQAQKAEEVNVKQVAYAIKPVEDPNIVAEAFTPSIEIADADTDKELFRVKSFWLLDPFSNELIIKEKSIHVISREFLRSQIETMLIQDVSIATLSHGIIFSSLNISYRIPHEDFFITNIPKETAIRAKAILDSLIIAKQAKSEKIEVLEHNTEGLTEVTPELAT